MSLETIRYATDGPVASITLDRPERLNTIVPPMPDEVEAAVERAQADGVRAAIEDRGGPFGDCSQAPPERRPDSRNVIDP